MATPRTGNREGRPRKDRDNFVDQCAKRYAAARRPKYPEKLNHDLYAATGDPLARDNPNIAKDTYGIETAPRPSRRLSEIRSLAFGDELDAILNYVETLNHNIAALDRNKSENIPSTTRELIADAVATFAERGTFIGGKAPVSFSRAIRAAFDHLAKRKDREDRRAQLGDTGRKLQVRPAVAGSIILDPITGEKLPAEGASVPDNAFWRRRIDQGDVLKI